MPLSLSVKIQHNLAKSSQNKGFTLLELLIIVILTGFLAATALPILITQVGKAREFEARSFLGTVNRTQISYFKENSSFSPDFSNLEVSIPHSTYYTYRLESNGLAIAQGKDNAKHGTRSYAGGVQYNPDQRQLTSILCRSLIMPNYTLTPQAIQHTGTTTTSDLACNFQESQKIQ